MHTPHPLRFLEVSTGFLRFLGLASLVFWLALPSARAEPPPTPTFNPDVYYQITNDAQPGQALALGPVNASGRQTVVLAKADPKDTKQRWRIETLGSVPVSYQLSLEALGDSMEFNSFLWLAVPGETGATGWALDPLQNGAYRIRLTSYGVRTDGYSLEYSYQHLSMQATKEKSAQFWRIVSVGASPKPAVTPGLLSARYSYGGARPVDPLTDQTKWISIGPDEIVKVEIWLTEKPQKPVHINYTVVNKDKTCRGGQSGDCDLYGFIEENSPDSVGDRSTRYWGSPTFTVPYTKTTGQGLKAGDTAISIRGNPYFRKKEPRDFYITFQMKSEDPKYNNKTGPSLQFRLTPNAGDKDIYSPANDSAGTVKAPAPTSPATPVPVVPYNRQPFLPQPGDKPGDLNPALKRCEAKHGPGSCEKVDLGFAAPKCKAGYLGNATLCVPR